MFSWFKSETNKENNNNNNQSIFKNDDVIGLSYVYGVPHDIVVVDIERLIYVSKDKVEIEIPQPMGVMLKLISNAFLLTEVLISEIIRQEYDDIKMYEYTLTIGGIDMFKIHCSNQIVHGSQNNAPHNKLKIHKDFDVFTINENHILKSILIHKISKIKNALHNNKKQQVENNINKMLKEMKQQ